MPSYKILDLFAGAGGFSLGFELVRDEDSNQVFELHRAVEIDKYACETLRNRYGKEKVIEGDLTKKKIHKQVVDECRNQVSVIIGGIPCQSFSLLGPRSGYGTKKDWSKEDKRDHLYKEFRKIVAELMPKIVVIENVKGILSKKNRKGKKIIDKILSDFENLGYSFSNENGEKYILLNAVDFGVPQGRERVFLIGILKCWKDISVPLINSTHYNPKTKNRPSKKLLPYVTLREAIGDLPKISPQITMTGLSKEERIKMKIYNRKIRNGEDHIIFDDAVFKDHRSNLGDSGKQFLAFIRPDGYKYIDHHIARAQQITDIKLFKAMRQGETASKFMDRKPKLAAKLIKYDMNTFKDKYRKQRWNKPCTTIFAHLEKDGNRFIHPGQIRTITPREAARIQSFPDNITFNGPLLKKFRQIGNAVPPIMANNIALKIYEVLK
jgi:DNA (cytosine-5)-methyltransferase 1